MNKSNTRDNRQFNKLLTNKNFYAGLALSTYLGANLIKSFLFRFMGLLHIPGFVLVSNLIPLVFALVSIMMGDKKRLKTFAIFMFGLCLALALSYLYNPDYYYWYFKADRGVVKYLLRPDSGIYIILFISLIDDIKALIAFTELGAWLAFAHSGLQYLAAQLRGYWIILNSRGQKVFSSYDLDFGYAVLFPTVFFMFKGSISKDKYKKLFYYNISLLGFIMILTAGSRGAMVVPVMYFFILLIKKLTKNDEKKEREDFGLDLKPKLKKAFLGLSFLAVLVLAVYILFVPKKVPTEEDFEKAEIESTEELNFDSMDSKSRNVDLLTSGNFFAGNGRERIIRLVLTELKERPFTGLGIFGDRPVVSQQFVWAHSHNVILEFLADFGIILGPILLLLYLVISFRMIFFEKNFLVSNYYLMVFIASMELLFSHSFWLVPYPWMALMVYKNFSGNIEKTRKTRLTTYLKGKKSILQIICGLLLLVLFVGGYKNYRTYKDNYYREKIEIDRPTVIITMDDSTETDYSAYKYLTRHHLKATSFITGSNIDYSERYISSEEVKEMYENDWDFQCGTYTNPRLVFGSEKDIEEEIRVNDILFERLGLEKPVATAMPYGLHSKKTERIISQDRNVLRLTKKPNPKDYYTYKELYKYDLTHLYSLNIGYNVDDEVREEFILENIDRAKEEKSLIVLNVGRLQRKIDKKGASLYTFYKVIDYLMDNNFEFMTIKELNDLALEKNIF